MEDRVSLRPVTEDDLALLERLTNDPGGTGPHEWHGWHDPHVWRHRWTENGLLGSAGGTLMIIHGGDAAGFVSWRQFPVGPASYCWELGIGIVPEARGQGVGTRAHLAIVGYLFAHTTANRIQAGTEITNVAEQRALEKAGFRREGVLREAGFRDGGWRDFAVYGILRREAARDGPAGEH
jgi:RimJ/RimL family protein N-acetyltransferase